MVDFYSVRALITRPEPQAQALADAIIRQHGQAWILPMLNIRPLEKTRSMRDILLSLDRYEKIIVTSRAAARQGYELIDRYWTQLPLYIKWYAIGKGTASALAEYDIKAMTSHKGDNSEALLSLPDFQWVSEQKILIIKGLEGRTLLSSTLTEQGAKVTSLEVYQRLRPEYPPETLVKLLESQRINVILCGSAETVTNLGHYLPKASRACQPLIVPGERVAQHALALGFQPVYCASGADNHAMLSTLAAHTLNSPEDPS